MSRGRAAIVITALAALLVALCALAVYFVALRHRAPPGPPPDLRGEWVQMAEDASYYQVATITDDTIEVFWYTPDRDRKDLYWSGTFVPPTTAKEPYSWESVNDLERAEASMYATREEKKTFIYKEGQLTYNVMYGHIKMTSTLRRVDDPNRHEPERAN